MFDRISETVRTAFEYVREDVRTALAKDPAEQVGDGERADPRDADPSDRPARVTGTAGK